MPHGWIRTGEQRESVRVAPQEKGISVVSELCSGLESVFCIVCDHGVYRKLIVYLNV